MQAVFIVSCMLHGIMHHKGDKHKVSKLLENKAIIDTGETIDLNLIKFVKVKAKKKTKKRIK